jgi:hypothetical protein
MKIRRGSLPHTLLLPLLPLLPLLALLCQSQPPHLINGKAQKKGPTGFHTCLDTAPTI